MTIRALDAKDVGVLVAVLRRSFATVAERFGLTPENCPRHLAFYTAARLKEDLDRGMRFYVSEEGKDTCGCVALEPARPGVFYLGRLAVLPEHRSRGFGRKLMWHALAEAATSDATRVEIALISEDKQLAQ